MEAARHVASATDAVCRIQGQAWKIDATALCVPVGQWPRHSPSGGLLRKGHPVGATDVAPIVELSEQLQGRCGQRCGDAVDLDASKNESGRSWAGRPQRRYP